MSTTTARPDIAEFAADVRAHLDDLPADDVDDLLDGLEADLADQADELGEAFKIPDAASYAAELRAAAGLPPRTAAAEKPQAPLRARLASWVRRGRGERGCHRHPRLPARCAPGVVARARSGAVASGDTSAGR